MLKEVSESEDSLAEDEEKSPSGGAKGAKGKESIIEGGGAEGKERGGMDPLLGVTIPTHSDQGEAKQKASQQSQMKQEIEDKNECDGESQNTEDQKEREDIKGDPEMAVIYVKTLLPVFADLFHSSQTNTVKKKILPVIHKLSHHITSEWLQDLCQSTEEPSFLSQICELVAVTIDNEVSHLWWVWQSLLLTGMSCHRMLRGSCWLSRSSRSCF